MIGKQYEINSEQLLIKSPIPILSLLEMNIGYDINSHCTLELRAIAEEGSYGEILGTNWSGKTISVFQKENSNEPLFIGVIEKIFCRKENQLLIVEINGIDATIKLDRQKKQRSFQKIEMTYRQVVQKVLNDYERAEVIWYVDADKQIKSPIIQYDETDWEFLMRLCSHFQKPIVADAVAEKPVFYFGLNSGKKRDTDRAEVLGKGFHSVYYQNSSYDDNSLREQAFYMEVETKENWKTGDRLAYESRCYSVYKRRITFIKGELLFTYSLGMDAVYRQKKIYNNALAGLRLEGTIEKTSEENVYLQLDIDGEQGADYPWAWAPETNNLCYCMPEAGTKATLYLPAEEEKQGRVILSTVRNDQNSRYADVQKREFVTSHYKKIGLYPDQLFMEGTSGGVSFSMSDQSGIRLESNSNISFLADGNVYWMGKNVEVFSPLEIVCKTPQSNIELCRDINIYAPGGVKTIGTGETSKVRKSADTGRNTTGQETEHWQAAFSAMAATPIVDLGVLKGNEDVIDLFVGGSVPKVANGSAAIALSEVMEGKKESETSFPDVFKSMDNYTVKGGYAVPEEVG